MKTLDCHRCTMHIGGHFGLASQRLPHCRKQEGTPTLAFTTHPVEASLLRGIVGGWHKLFQLCPCEPTAHLLMDGLVVEQMGTDAFGQQGKEFLDIIGIDMGVATTRIVEGYSQTWHCMTHKERKCLFQRIEATDTNDSIDHTALNEFDDLGESFGHNAQATQLLNLVLQTGYGTIAASVTEQSVLVNFGLAHLLSAQAFGQHQQSSLVRNGCHDG